MPAPVLPDTRNANRAAITSCRMSAACGAIAPESVNAARSWVAGRRTRSDNAGSGDSDRRQNRVQSHRALRPRRVGQKSVDPGLRIIEPSARREREPLRQPPDRTLRRRSESELRRNPFPSSIHTQSGAVTRTSVVSGAVRSGSNMPAPVNSVCSTRRFASTSVSPSTPPDSSRIARATMFGRIGPVSAARRSRTRSTVRQLTPPAPASSRAASSTASTCAGCRGQRRASGQPQSAMLQFLAEHRLRTHRRQQRQPTMSANSPARSPPGDGPRTTNPTFGLIPPAPMQLRWSRTGPHITGCDHDDKVRGSIADLVTASSGAVADRTPPCTTDVVPASTTASTAPRAMSWARREPDNTLTPRCLGSASRTADQLRRPSRTSMSGQRSPLTASAPTSRSMPPPHGSRSTNSEPVADNAIAAANSDAPAPPRPPTTAATGPRPAWAHGSPSRRQAPGRARRTGTGGVKTPGAYRDRGGRTSASAGLGIYAVLHHEKHI